MTIENFKIICRCGNEMKFSEGELTSMIASCDVCKDSVQIWDYFMHNNLTDRIKENYKSIIEELRKRMGIVDKKEILRDFI